MSHLSSRRCTIATTVLLLHFFLSVCTAHMVMSEPPPINYKTNPYYSTAKADFDYTSPLTQSGSNYPCKGHLKDYNAPEGQSVRNYAPGGTYDLKIDGSAVHGGGSCQASLSFDGGNTWTVIKSWIGDCPHASGGTQDFTFTIPAGTPSGKAVFAWTWFNQIGNREMYMNCAVVTITGSKKNRLKRALSGPNVFVANIGNGCSTTAGTDLVFPDSGTDIQYAGDPSKRAGPAGTCSAKQYTGGGATVTTGGTGGSSSGTGGENPSNSGAASSAVGGSSGGSSGNQGLYTQTTTGRELVQALVQALAVQTLVVQAPETQVLATQAPLWTAT
ncbi:hypothetical protein BDD12DRAFT_894370 [Trichophaea hybrida]|nr:hypothetical protein BDD12DRAFT_894370 [Trichophaea hybrida]